MEGQCNLLTLPAFVTSSPDSGQLPALVASLLAATREEDRLVDDLCLAVLSRKWSEATTLATTLTSRRGHGAEREAIPAALGQA